MLLNSHQQSSELAIFGQLSNCVARPMRVMIWSQSHFGSIFGACITVRNMLYCMHRRASYCAYVIALTIDLRLYRLVASDQLHGAYLAAIEHQTARIISQVRLTPGDTYFVSEHVSI